MTDKSPLQTYHSTRPQLLLNQLQDKLNQVVVISTNMARENQEHLRTIERLKARIHRLESGHEIILCTDSLENARAMRSWFQKRH